MEEYVGMSPDEPKKTSAPRPNRWLLALLAAMVVVLGVALGYGYKQQIMVGHLTAEETMAKATISQMQGQLELLSAKLNEMTAAEEAARERARKASQAEKKNGAEAHSTAKRGARVDKRYKQFEAELEEQQKRLKETQELVAKNRTDLEGSLSSTRDDLNGSIAKTHEELVALAKRGERSYFEFDLTKSKQFERVGPVTLSLRKADTKHKSYDVEMMVDDNHLTKKKVNLYEPIWIHVENESEPVQIVVNRVEKNLVHGYVSAPKYKPSELSRVGSASVTPVAAHPEERDPHPSIPKQPE
jgi:hypothetical protein